jgi:hypothetical protein
MDTIKNDYGLYWRAGDSDGSDFCLDERDCDDEA